MIDYSRIRVVSLDINNSPLVKKASEYEQVRGFIETATKQRKPLKPSPYITHLAIHARQIVGAANVVYHHKQGMRHLTIKYMDSFIEDSDHFILSMLANKVIQLAADKGVDYLNYDATLDSKSLLENLGFEWHDQHIKNGAYGMRLDNRPISPRRAPLLITPFTNATGIEWRITTDTGHGVAHDILSNPTLNTAHFAIETHAKIRKSDEIYNNLSKAFNHDLSPMAHGISVSFHGYTDDYAAKINIPLYVLREYHLHRNVLGSKTEWVAADDNTLEPDTL